MTARRRSALTVAALEPAPQHSAPLVGGDGTLAPAGTAAEAAGTDAVDVRLLR